MSDDWTTTLHLAYRNGYLSSASICSGTVFEVAERVKAKMRNPVFISRVYPVGERDWPVELVYDDPSKGTDEGEWRHVFRRPDEPWVKEEPPPSRIRTMHIPLPG